MLFSEIYSSYFSTAAAVLAEAAEGTLTEKRLTELVREKAFGESVLTLPGHLKSPEWGLLTPDLKTPLQHVPTMPLTTLQKRWLKALLRDPRIRLFSPSEEGLEDVEPLYGPDTFVYYDRYTDGDPFGDPKYIEHFRTVLSAMREHRRVWIRFESSRPRRNTWACIPYRLEYSAKDDKFRLLTSFPDGRRPLSINIARITQCRLGARWEQEEYRPLPFREETLVLRLTDERNALERAMLHFSHLEKETKRLDESHYRLTLRYQTEDETELLIRVLSFGPVMEVEAPERFRDLIRDRLRKQKDCRL